MSQPRSSIRSSKQSKVAKVGSNQSTLSAFFGLSLKPSQKGDSSRQNAKLVRAVKQSIEKPVDQIDLTVDDDTDILKDISNSQSVLSSLRSDSFEPSTLIDIADDDDDLLVKSNLKSNRPIGSILERSSSFKDYSRTDLTQNFYTGSFQSTRSDTTVNRLKTSKQRNLPWTSSSGMVVNKLASKNPRLLASSMSSSKAHDKIGTSSSITLSDEQRQVLKYIIDEKLNVFYTGSAGTGKSVLLKELIRKLYKKYGSNCVAVTASTGLAAVNIGGQTINRFAGIGLGKESVPALVTKINKNRVSEKWKKTKVLIIDEVSMIDGNLFHKLNQIAKIVRSNNRPFGGIQVIVTGDFFQLPPVPDRNGPRPTFCFQSPSWPEVIQRTILLTKVFRQKGDTELINMLNALRLGDVSPDMVNKFRSLLRPIQYADGLEPTELFPLREEVDRANKVRLDKLPSEVRAFPAIDSGVEQYRNMLDNVMALKTLLLKEDAQVMMLKNKNEYLVNGSIGKVMYFVTPNLWLQINKTYRADLDVPQTIREVRLLTKCVGISFFTPELEEEINQVRTPAFEKLVQLATRELSIDLIPVVKFSTIDGMSEIELVEPDDFSVDVKGGAVNRKQIPLVLSWALSIHKSQGQTLERVKVDLNKVFENGQVYVALSRAVSKEALQIVGFNPLKIRCSPDVRKFYENLERFNEEKTIL